MTRKIVFSSASYLGVKAYDLTSSQYIELKLEAQAYSDEMGYGVTLSATKVNGEELECEIKPSY